jgi:hypothetical protein
MAIETSDIRYHGNQYGHRIVVSGDTLLFLCELVGVRDPENLTDEDQEAISAVFNEMIQKACADPETPTIIEQI